MEPVDGDEALAWVRAAAHSGSDWVGFDVELWDASAWILHAMYETEALPSGLSYDDEYKIDRAAGIADPLGAGEAAIEKMLEDATVIGNPLGPSSAPGSGWRRLFWAELARREGVNPLDQLPSFRSFPFRSWPTNIRSPGEGSIDRDQLQRLLTHLTDVTADATDCFVFLGRGASGRVDDEHDELLVLRGSLTEVLAVYDEEGGPTNMWPVDRSWFLYSDWDLWGTKVSGRPDLIGRLSMDDELEAVRLTIP